MNREEKLEKVKKEVLDLERESLANITKTQDQQMIAKIIKIYEESENDNK